MQDYCDSPSFKEHPLFRDYPNALQIQLYYDDVEVVNPLGGNTKVHKLGKQHGTKAHVACNPHPCTIYPYTCSSLTCASPSGKILTGACPLLFQTGLFYYTLGNLPPKFRSRLQAIHLLMVVKVQHIQLYGIDEVLAPVIDDLKTLEKVRGTCMVIVNVLFKCIQI